MLFPMFYMFYVPIMYALVPSYNLQLFYFRLAKKAPLQRKANVSNFVFQETKLNDRQIRHIQHFFL